MYTVHILEPGIPDLRMPGNGTWPKKVYTVDMLTFGGGLKKVYTVSTLDRAGSKKKEVDTLRMLACRDPEKVYTVAGLDLRKVQKSVYATDVGRESDPQDAYRIHFLLPGNGKECIR